MFQFPEFPSTAYVFSWRYRWFAPMGFPIRKSPVITLIDSLPRLIAAYHVLHRHLTPRHPPCALSNFIHMWCGEIEVFTSKRLLSSYKKPYWFLDKHRKRTKSFYVFDKVSHSLQNVMLYFFVQCVANLQQHTFGMLFLYSIGNVHR